MTDYMQRTSNREGFENPVMVSFKTDLTDKFYDLVSKSMKDVGAYFFAHNLIKNCLQEGHTVSSFVTNPDWQEKYWNSYWDCDSLANSSYKIARINGCAITSWKVVNANDDCTEDRKSVYKMNDGLAFWMQHDNGVVENFSFGWEKYDVNQVTRQKLTMLSNMITDFRIQHFRATSEMFDAYPAVDFH